MKKTDNKSIRALIVDDEPPSIELLKVMLAEYGDIEIIGSCTSGTEAGPMIRTMRPDVVFLDIQMPGKKGFDVLQELDHDNLPFVVFVTAYDEYAVKAFESHAVDYLLKPVDYDRLRVTVERVRDLVDQEEEKSASAEVMTFERTGRSRDYLQRILLRKSGKISILKITDVDVIEADGDYLKFLVRDRSYLMREKLGGLEKSLDPAHFVRVHRSTIVNISRIKEMERTFNQDHIITLLDGKQIQLSRRYFDHVMKVLRSAPLSTPT